MSDKLKVHTVKIADLHDDPRNARFHGPRNLDSIRDSLKNFGQVEPLVVNKKTNQIIGGHGRVNAMIELGWDTVEVVYVDLDDTKAAALGIALNRTAELAEWNEQVLADTLTNLDSEGFQLGEIGFNEDELAKLMGVVSFESTSEDGAESDGFSNDGGVGDDGFVAFQFGDYRGRVRQSIYDDFVENYKRIQSETGEVMLDDIIESWLGKSEIKA